MAETPDMRKKEKAMIDKVSLMMGVFEVDRDGRWLNCWEIGIFSAQKDDRYVAFIRFD